MGRHRRPIGASEPRWRAAGADAVILTFSDGRQVALPSSHAEVLRTSAREVADGHGLTVLPSDATLTPAEAAELLGLSRPFVARLLDEGEIPSERLPGSRHRRVRLADVLEFAERHERAVATALMASATVEARRLR